MLEKLSQDDISSEKRTNTLQEMREHADRLNWTGKSTWNMDLIMNRGMDFLTKCV